MQLLEARGAQKRSDAVAAQPGLADQPASVLHPMVEQHCVRFGDGVVSQPSELERVVRARVSEVERVSQLVQESVVIALTPVRTQHEGPFLGESDRGAETA